VRIIKIILVLIVFAFIASTVWQVASCEIANYELKDDLKDIASMGGRGSGCRHNSPMTTCARP
jgi:hypothetical protein